MLKTTGKASLAALSVLVGASALGILPVGQFFWRTPASGSTPVPPPHPIPADPGPIGPGVLQTSANPSRGTVRSGPITVEGALGQSKLAVSEDGTIYVDVKVTGAESKLASERRPVDLALVLDVSGSMAGENKITLMKEACRRLEPQLSADDRVAIIAFSTNATVLMPLTSLGEKGSVDRSRYLSAIEELVPTASTNIAGGLETGAAELKRLARSGAARRLLLLTDGIANVGNCTPDGLTGLTRKLANEGFSVSTVGLGLDYQATLLSAMAEAGGGNFHYVESSSRIVGVFDAEFRGLRSLVAKGVRLTLTPQEGTEIVQVVEWNAEQKGSAFSVNVGDIESGRSTKIVARLRVPTGRTVDAANVLSISFRGEDARTSETLAPSPLVLGVGFTKSAEEARASIDKDVQHDFVTAQVSVQLEAANAAAARGDEAKCKDALETLRRSGVRELRYRGADGKDSVMALEEYEKRALKGDAGQRQDAQNLCKSAAAQAGK